MNIRHRQQKLLAAFAESILPRDGAVMPGAGEAQVSEKLSALVADFDSFSQVLVGALLTGLELSPLASRHLRPFSWLSPEAQARHVAACESGHSALSRQVVSGLKALAVMAYCTDERVAALIGYDRQPYKPMTGERADAAGRLPCVNGAESNRDMEVKADVCIVGSGAGGAVVAAELAEGGLSVIILEEGWAVSREDFESPAMERAARFYRDNGLTTTLGAPPISLPMGKVVGGTTVVNSGTCFRTPERVLAAWQQSSGLTDLNPAQLAPLFEGVERALNVTPVSDDILGRNGELLRRGAEALGLSHRPVARPVRGCHGSGECAFGCPLDAKQAMHLSYLPRAVAAGARIYAGARAEKIIAANGRAVGVRAGLLDAEGKRRHTLTVRAQFVVLAAGAIYTPLLLIKSGLANRQVGRHLHIHPGYGVTALFDQDIFGWKGVMQSYAVDARLDDGYLLLATFPPPGVGYSAGAAPGVGAALKERLGNYKRMAALGTVVSDTGAGRVRAVGGGALITYNLNDVDRRRVLESIALAARLYFAAEAREVYPGLPGLSVLRSESEVEYVTAGRWRANDLKLSAYHPMGTCRMGSDPRTSVTDGQGRVHNVPGLYVADASLMPGSTAVNPQMTIMALATRVARGILERRT
ncbi:MAG: GMC family oxidoreductase N-terminal domain-containing protein [Chloroflexi bacterium]|nr:GMC family oxidoreductase N-terminal domain-containing protein [Chloroflexota bacterium]